MPALRWARVAPGEGRGAGLPPLLLIHGFATTVTQCWISTGWLRRLGPERDLVLIQLPWHDDAALAEALTSGFPDRRLEEHSLPLEDSEECPLTAQDVIDGLSEIVHETTRTLPRPAVDVLGYSLGARLAWDLAGEEPHRVRRLCLGGLPATDRLADLARVLEGPGRGRADSAVSEGSPDPAVSEVPDGPGDSHGPQSSARPVGTPDPAVTEVLRFVESSNLPPEGLARCAERLSRPKFSPSPHNAPVQEALLVSGEADVVADDAILLTYLPATARHVSLPRRNHVDALTSGQFVRAVASFLDEH